jgi:hypothetical protein
MTGGRAEFLWDQRLDALMKNVAVCREGMRIGERKLLFNKCFFETDLDFAHYWIGDETGSIHR